MHPSTILALSLGQMSPSSLFGKARPVSQRDKAQLAPKFVADAKAKAEAKRARKSAKR